jgi:thiopurine S-methyltransferase
METDFWLERWQRGETGFHQAEVNVDLRTHWAAVRAPLADSVFVPQCGRSHDMVWLRSLGHRVIGVELSDLAVQGFFADLGLVPNRRESHGLEVCQAEGYALYRGDLFALRAEDVSGCGAVYDRAALIALPPAMRQRYVQHLRAILPAAANTLLLTMDYPQQQMNGPPFSVDATEVRRLFEPLHSVKLLGTRDTLANEPRLQQRGLQRLQEQAWLLQRAR